MFGNPDHRLRCWRIIYNKRKKLWSSPYTFEELVGLLLAPLKCSLLLDSSAYLVASQHELGDLPVLEKDLSRCWCVQIELQSCWALCLPICHHPCTLPGARPCISRSSAAGHQIEQSMTCQPIVMFASAQIWLMEVYLA